MINICLQIGQMLINKSFIKGGVIMQTKTEKKIVYTKPVVLAATKKGSNFSAGCASKGAMTCMACRCR